MSGQAARRELRTVPLSSSLFRGWPRLGGFAGLALALTTAALLEATGGPRFFPDDPLWVDNDRALNAGAVQPSRVVSLKDAVANTLTTVGDRRPLRALNINTVGEVPDSSWFTNRIGRHPMSIETLVKGPDRFVSLSIDGWPIVEGKGIGLQPGFRVQDPEGHLYQVKFDTRARPEMSTAAEIIGTAFFHAFGYHVAEAYLVEFDPAKTVIAPGALISDGGGRERRLVRQDIEDALVDAAPLPNGKYRGLASRFIEGEPLGGFRYWGTRPDDPNDIFPHEHRRELRGLRVFAAWLNHDEADSTNTYDALQTEGSRSWVQHYLLDFGSLLGSDTIRQQRGRSGNEYLLEWQPGLMTAATLGVYVRPWLKVHYPDLPPSVGRFEADYFDPTSWRPVYPNPAFDNLQPDDAFWAARVVARFDAAALRAVVAKGRYSDPAAVEYIVRTLERRRDKVLRAWLNGVNPIVAPRLDGDRLTFENAAVSAGVATDAERYSIGWHRFDNATDTKTPVDTDEVTEPAATLPSALAGADYVAAEIVSHHAGHAAWSQPVTVYFRRTPAGWETVGIDR
jgi:hypothetical protein